MPNEQIGEEVKVTPAQPLEEVTKEETPEEPTQEQKNIDEEAQKKQEQLTNLNTAIDLANDELRNLRKGIKTIKSASGEDELPKIDMEDPSSRAWDQHIVEKVAPVQRELEQEKQEVRSYALREFLADKPLLAKSPEKVKQLISSYEALSAGRISEKTKEGVLLYLDKAYAAENYDELLAVSGQKRVNKAKADIAFSDIATSKGATGYPSSKESTAPLTADDRAILAKWNLSEEEWQEMDKKQKAKKE